MKSDVAALKEAGAEDKLVPLRDEVAQLKQMVTGLADREPVPASDAAALTDLEGRLSALADDVAALKSAGPGDTSAVTAAVADLKQQVEALSAALDKKPDEARIGSVESRLDGLETKLNEVDTRLKELATGLDAARAKIDERRGAGAGGRGGCAFRGARSGPAVPRRACRASHVLASTLRRSMRWRRKPTRDCRRLPASAPSSRPESLRSIFRRRSRRAPGSSIGC